MEANKEKWYGEGLDWIEVPLWKALKMWANNGVHVRCVLNNWYSFYHCSEPITVRQQQVQEGVWYIAYLK
ncbi:hypothetical protein Bp8pC_182 [Bacillus phage Bp8p-C]|uniref:Uncharacterized protein n=2 Tax=Agatevirus Bp8pC TaxID=1910937 RepID=A0A0A0PLS5_9CAUD|nr:hypothetical protein AXJ20_gp166 [Bacillus phage Bp8p-C]YP_009784482.1 hypothetical protein QLX39_gp166 [Bacillus phage Bp8p-T]AHJ87612.1 hypothetical protein Bp8pC_182 [Bacillus phage Bp8p-C]AHJ87823.1 hypothetical protein Bp8pT_182 [Bacillus phage Bp8p-T]